MQAGFVFGFGFIKSINQHQAITFIHSLDGNVDNYIADLTFKDTSSINNVYYGGMLDSSGQFLGTTWRDLTTYSITLFSGDVLLNDEVHVRIWVYD